MIQLFNWFRRGSLERGLDRELAISLRSPHRRSHVRRCPRARGSPPRRHRPRASPRSAKKFATSGSAAGSATSSTISASPLRSLPPQPRFTAAPLLSLALGIGATTAIYSLVDQVILHALPVRDPEQLVLDRLGRRPCDRRLRLLQPDVVPALPRPPASDPCLRRRASAVPSRCR